MKNIKNSVIHMLSQFLKKQLHNGKYLNIKLKWIKRLKSKVLTGPEHLLGEYLAL